MRTILIVVFFMTLLSSCVKEGCKDPTALNYSPSAQRNEGCSYSEDRFTGKFYVIDTALIDDYFSTRLNIDTYQFTVVRDSVNRIKLVNFFNCNSNLYAIVDTHVFYDLNVVSFCGGDLSAAHFVMRGDSLRYDTRFGDGSYNEERWGLARRH